MTQCLKCNQTAMEDDLLCDYCSMEDIFNCSTADEPPTYESMRFGQDAWERKGWQIQSGIYWNQSEDVVRINAHAQIPGNYDGWKNILPTYEVPTIGLDGV